MSTSRYRFLRLDPETKKITVTLATNGDGGIDEENTAKLVAAAINDDLTAYPLRRWRSTAPSPRLRATCSSTTATRRLWRPSMGLTVTRCLTVGDIEAKTFEPLAYFPRFLGGRITLTATPAPTKDTVTVVHIREV